MSFDLVDGLAESFLHLNNLEDVHLEMNENVLNNSFIKILNSLNNSKNLTSLFLSNLCDDAFIFDE